MSSKKDEIRQRAEDDIYVFAKLIGPGRLYGEVHREALAWLTRNDAKLDLLLMLPRGHLKSHLVAIWCTWWITKNPDTSILYISATEDVAIKQLTVIKDILSSDVHRRYWPDLVHPDESMRKKWAMKDICVDHPIRQELGLRDSTVAARGITGNTTGLHCDVLILDDIVVMENAYTEAGRQEVRAGYAAFSSVLNTGGRTIVVGTRYDGKDIYGSMMSTEREIFSDDGEITGTEKVFEVFDRVVETEGIFLWPREQHATTKKWYGFNHKELATIRAKYFASGERANYYAQYYNNPNGEMDEDEVTSDHFQYYSPAKLTYADGKWHYDGYELRTFAGGDLAYTVNDTSDFTAFAVIGIDSRGFIYVLELVQFRTNKYARYYSELSRLQEKWGFSRCRIETNAGANLVVEYMKDQFRAAGRAVVLDGKNNRLEKIERKEAVLMPRYESKTMWHCRGGYIGIYEEQILLKRPSNDDLADAMGIAVEIAKPPSQNSGQSNVIKFTSHSRFGGRMRVS